MFSASDMKLLLEVKPHRLPVLHSHSSFTVYYTEQLFLYTDSDNECRNTNTSVTIICHKNQSKDIQEGLAVASTEQDVIV